MRNRHHSSLLPWALAAMLLGAPCRAGLDFTTGREWHLWTEGQFSVVVARVSEISALRPDEPGGTHKATLEPIALLAGSLDPSENPTPSVTFYGGGNNTSILSPSARGATVLAVLQGTNFVVSDICTFMPGNSSLITVNGLGDPRIAETLKKLQEARAHPDPDPYGKPVTRPSTRPPPHATDRERR